MYQKYIIELKYLQRKKKTRKIYYHNNWAQYKYLMGYKAFQNILPGLEQEKVENHWLAKLVPTSQNCLT